MSASDFGQFVLTIAAFLAIVHGLGYLAERLKQPRIVGEILAGILLGPFVLKFLLPGAYAKLFSFSTSGGTVLGFLYQMGLILLMFCSGAETRRLLGKENRKTTVLLITVSDIASFIFVLGLGFLGFIPLARLTGTLGQNTSTLLVVAIATSVTSIPVISRIFWDLGIMRTRFVSLLLGYAVLEDIALWIVLAFATALAKSATLVNQNLTATVSSHVLGTFIYMTVAMAIMPTVLRYLGKARWNIIVQASPVGYVVFVLMAYCAVAALVDVNLQFAALLAGYGVVVEFAARSANISPFHLNPSPKSRSASSSRFTSAWSATGSSLAANSPSPSCSSSSSPPQPSPSSPPASPPAWVDSAASTSLTSPSPPTPAEGPASSSLASPTTPASSTPLSTPRSSLPPS